MSCLPCLCASVSLWFILLQNPKPSTNGGGFEDGPTGKVGVPVARHDHSRVRQPGVRGYERAWRLACATFTLGMPPRSDTLGRDASGVRTGVSFAG